MVQIKTAKPLKIMLFLTAFAVMFYILITGIVVTSPVNVYAKNKKIAGDIKPANKKGTKLSCTCTSKCSKDVVNEECEACKDDYSNCTYITPKVKISILKPDGWYKDGTAIVKTSVKDIAGSENFIIDKVEARIGQSGDYTDITDDMCIKVTENCSVYVQVTDINGKVYNKNSSIQCYDNDRPSLNAGINNGLLSIQASDSTSGIMEIYVNRQKFTKIKGETKNIRLQKSDTRYENFTIQAVDKAGNMSDVYTIKNPYYKDSTAKKENSSREETQTLPENVLPTGSTDARATVKDYTNTANSTGRQDTSGISLKKGDKTASSGGTVTENTVKEGKEFYTIKTDNEKIFYLVIDNTKGTDNVYFLTEISENDLLNVTGTDYETLGQDMAVADGTGNVNNGEDSTEENATDGKITSGNENGDKDSSKEDKAEEKKKNPTGTYIFLGVAGIISIAALYYFKVLRRKNEDFEDEEDETGDYEEEVYESEEEDTEDGRTAFLTRKGAKKNEGTEEILCNTGRPSLAL